MSDRVRIEIGFDSGQVMAALVSPESADRLEQALATKEDGSLPLEVDDGRYILVLNRVVYVKRFSREARVGFGS